MIRASTSCGCKRLGSNLKIEPPHRSCLVVINTNESCCNFQTRHPCQRKIPGRRTVPSTTPLSAICIACHVFWGCCIAGATHNHSVTCLTDQSCSGFKNEIAGRAAATRAFSASATTMASRRGVVGSLTRLMHLAKGTNNGLGAPTR